MLTGLTLAVTSCGGQPRLAIPEVRTPPTTSPAKVQTLSPATPIVRQPEIGEIVWASSIEPTTNDPVDRVTSYAAEDPSIIATAPGSSLPRGAAIDASWTYNNTPLEGFSTRLTSEGVQETHWIVFRLDRDPEVSWPAGAYEVTISLNGEEVQRASIEVATSS